MKTCPAVICRLIFELPFSFLLCVPTLAQTEPTASQPSARQPVTLPAAVLGAHYAAALPLVGAVGQVKSELTRGQLPLGIQLQGNWVRGQPEATGTFSFEVSIVDDIGQRAQGQFSLEIVMPPAPPLRLPKANLPQCVACVPYSAALPIEGGYPPYSWEMREGRLPEGLSLKDGQITGIAKLAVAEAARSTLTVSVRDTLGQSATQKQEFVLAPNPGILLSIQAQKNGTVEELPTAVFGEMYSVTLPLKGGFGKIEWTLTGTLPDGLGLSQGSLSGKPGKVGTWVVAVTVRDELGQTTEGRFQLRVLPPSPPPIRVVSDELSPAVLGEPYAAVLKAEGGIPPYRWELVEGTLPAWALLRGDVITGKPHDVSALGTCRLSVKVTDSLSTETAPHAFVLSVKANPDFPPPTIAGSPLPTGIVGSPYRFPIPVAGGLPPYTFVSESGNLPQGLMLEGDGELQGTPAVEGEWKLVVRAKDSLGQLSAPATLALTTRRLAPSELRIGRFSPLLAVAGQPFEYQLPVSGGVLPYTYSVAESLPPGLTVNPATGLLSGTSRMAGRWSRKLQVADASPEHSEVSRLFEISVVPPQPPWWRWGLTGLLLGTLVGIVITAAGIPSAILCRIRPAAPRLLSRFRQ